METKIKLPELETPVLPASSGERPVLGTIIAIIIRVLVK
jgi:hypothetical protein